MSKIVFDILHKAGSVYATAKGYEALPFIPGELIKRKSKHEAEAFDKLPEVERPTQSVTTSPLRKFKNGVHYFMPVSFEYTDQETNAKSTWEFDDAVVSITAKKTIVETPLVGRKGTVKELISIDDYEIKLVAVVSGDDYPEQEIQEIVKLYEINENIKMICPMTDYFLKSEEMVVIKSLELPAMEGNEDMQIITMTLVSDKQFELEKK